MKALLALTLTALISSQSFAGQCVDDKGNDILRSPDLFQELIAQKKTCYEAVQLAESCAWGSSLDVSTAGVAYNVCLAQAKKSKPQSRDYALLRKMEARCNEKYSKMEGTLYRSMNAFCQLKAIEWLNTLVSEN